MELMQYIHVKLNTISEDARDSKPDYLLKNISEAKQKIREVEKLFSEDSIAQRALESRNQVCTLLRLVRELLII